jgi:transposase-like protein
MSSKGENKSDLTRDEARILSTLAEKGLISMRPVQSGDALAYEGLEELAKELPGKNISEILKSLLDKGYLKESDYHNILVCPSCNSVNILTSYSCPHCQSRKIRKSKLAEHKLCGYIGNLDDFDQVDGYLCPKCKTHIAKISSDQTGVKAEVLRVIGSSFVCDICGAKFEKPSIIYTCNHCESDFTSKEASHIRIPAYEVVKKLELSTLKQLYPDHAEEEVDVKTQSVKQAQEPVGKSPPKSASEATKGIESAFKKRGFTFEYGYKLRGKSGFEQSFDAVAKKGKITVLIDISQTGDQADLIGLVGKKKDVDVGSIILLDITGNPYLVSLGKQYAITVLDGRSGEYSKIIADILGGEGEE